MARPNLSILIISFNSWSHLDACLRSIYAGTCHADEIVVIDNNSMDGSCEKIKTTYPQIRLIQNNENIGHTRAVNQGFELIRAERILLLDADTELNLDTIATMMQFLDQHLDVSMVAPRTYNSDGTIQESARNFPSITSGLFGRQSLFTRLFPNNRFAQRYLIRENLNRQTPFPVQQISSACMLFRKVLLDNVGLWDTGYRGYWVDTDWCKIIQKANGIIYCLPQTSIIHHEQNKGFRKKNPRRIIDFHAGAYRLYRRHYTSGTWDPRNLIAAVLLTTRAVILLVINTCQKSPPSHKDPLSLKKGSRST